MWIIVWVNPETFEGSELPDRTGWSSANYKPDSPLVYIFRMLDDDGIVHYHGMSDDDSSFAPLDDLGRPDVGCVTIEYWNFEKTMWEPL